MEKIYTRFELSLFLASFILILIRYFVLTLIFNTKLE